MRTMMPTIRVDQDVWTFLQSKAKPFEEGRPRFSACLWEEASIGGGSETVSKGTFSESRFTAEEGLLRVGCQGSPACRAGLKTRHYTRESRVTDVVWSYRLTVSPASDRYYPDGLELDRAHRMRFHKLPLQLGNSLGALIIELEISNGPASACTQGRCFHQW